jgi:hypothetical protein
MAVLANLSAQAAIGRFGRYFNWIRAIWHKKLSNLHDFVLSLHFLSGEPAAGVSWFVHPSSKSYTERS